MFTRCAVVVLSLAFAFAGTACQRAGKKAPPPSSYDSSITLEQKARGVLPWSPADADLIAIIDTNKLLTSTIYKILPSDIRNTFPWEYIHSGGNALSAKIGMVASFIKFGSKEDPFRYRALLLQGDLKKDDILKGIEESSKKESKQLDVTSESGIEMYRYTDDDDLNSIAFLEPHLVAIGTKEGLEWIASEHKKNLSRTTSASIFDALDLTKTAAANVSMTAKLKEFFPPLFHSIQTVGLNAGVAEGLDIKVVFSFSAPDKAVEFAKNLEGLKAIEEITSLDNKWLKNLIGAIRISAEGGRVTGEVSISADLLLKLLGDEDK